MAATRQPLRNVVMFGALLCSSASFSSPLLPSQEQPNFFNVRICRDRQVLAALKTAAAAMLKTNVVIAKGNGPEWSGYQPDDIHLEAVSLSSREKNAVFCSESRLRESAQGDKWSFCLTAGKISPRASLSRYIHFYNERRPH